MAAKVTIVQFPKRESSDLSNSTYLNKIKMNLIYHSLYLILLGINQLYVHATHHKREFDCYYPEAFR